MLSAATKRTCYSIGSDEYTIFYTNVWSIDLDCCVALSSPFRHSSAIIAFGKWNSRMGKDDRFLFAYS